MDRQQQGDATTACKHKPGDEWADGCCGNDALAKANSEQMSQQSELEQHRRELIGQAEPVQQDIAQSPKP